MAVANRSGCKSFGGSSPPASAKKGDKMKKIVLLLFALMFAGCASQYRNINGFDKIQKHAQKWCELGCIRGIKDPDYNKVRDCYHFCLETSLKDIKIRELKEKCRCDLGELK